MKTTTDVFRDLLIKVLETIGYGERKDAFADEFAKCLYIQTVADLLQSLPQNEQDDILGRIEHSDNKMQVINEVTDSKFPTEQLRAAAEKVAKSALTEYLSSISAVLSQTQREHLYGLFRHHPQ